MEALAQILPIALCPDLISGRYLSFVDNEAAKHALVKGYRSVTSVNRIIIAFWLTCENRKLDPWFERVSTGANITDAVSRDDLGPGLERGWKLLSPDTATMFDTLRQTAKGVRQDFTD